MARSERLQPETISKVSPNNPKLRCWTSREEERLLGLIQGGKSIADMAAELGRSRYAVTSRAYDLGYSLQKTRGTETVRCNETAILEALNERWHTVSQVRSRLKMRSTGGWLASSLRKMASQGIIEMRCEETKARKRRAGRFSIEYFRRRS